MRQKGVTWHHLASPGVSYRDIEEPRASEGRHLASLGVSYIEEPPASEGRHLASVRDMEEPRASEGRHLCWASCVWSPDIMIHASNTICQSKCVCIPQTHTYTYIYIHIEIHIHLCIYI